MSIALLWSTNAVADCPATPDLTIAAADLALKAGNADAVHQALTCLIPVASALKDQAANRPSPSVVTVKHLDVPIILSPVQGH